MILIFRQALLIEIQIHLYFAKENRNNMEMFVLLSSFLCEVLGYDYQEILVDVQELFETVYLPFVRKNGNKGILPENKLLPNNDINVTTRHPYNIDPVKFLYIMTDIIHDYSLHKQSNKTIFN
jgi:hypothetical protein